MPEDELEGAYSYTGDPDDPELTESAVDSGGLLGRVAEQQRRKETVVEVGDKQATLHELDLAEAALERAREAAAHISPVRVVIATLVMAAMLVAIPLAAMWVIPFDQVTTDVVYKQGGPGQVVLLELHNDGSREITSITLQVQFVNQSGAVLGSTVFTRADLPAHASVAGDDLELIITGESNWETYDILIDLEYTSYGGNVEKGWSIEVGEWTSQQFSLDTPLKVF